MLNNCDMSGLLVENVATVVVVVGTIGAKQLMTIMFGSLPKMDNQEYPNHSGGDIKNGTSKKTVATSKSVIFLSGSGRYPGSTITSCGYTQCSN